MHKAASHAPYSTQQSNFSRLWSTDCLKYNMTKLNILLSISRTGNDSCQKLNSATSEISLNTLEALEDSWSRSLKLKMKGSPSADVENHLSLFKQRSNLYNGTAGKDSNSCWVTFLSKIKAKRRACWVKREQFSEAAAWTFLLHILRSQHNYLQIQVLMFKNSNVVHSYNKHVSLVSSGLVQLSCPSDFFACVLWFFFFCFWLVHLFSFAWRPLPGLHFDFATVLLKKDTMYPHLF